MTVYSLIINEIRKLFYLLLNYSLTTLRLPSETSSGSGLQVLLRAI